VQEILCKLTAIPPTIVTRRMPRLKGAALAALNWRNLDPPVAVSVLPSSIRLPGISTSAFAAGSCSILSFSRIGPGGKGKRPCLSRLRALRLRGRRGAARVVCNLESCRLSRPKRLSIGAWSKLSYRGKWSYFSRIFLRSDMTQS
jgi:hypothetical protein